MAAGAVLAVDAVIAEQGSLAATKSGSLVEKLELALGKSPDEDLRIHHQGLGFNCLGVHSYASGNKSRSGR